MQSSSAAVAPLSGKSVSSSAFVAVPVHPLLVARRERAANSQHTLASLDAAIAKLRASRLVLAGGAR